MSRRDPYVALRHMRDHAREAVEYSRGRSRADLDNDRLLNLALVRLVEIVGEAAARVPQAMREQLGEIPWPAIVGMRNRLVHGYDTINFDILWTILTTDLPPLIEELDRVFASRDRPASGP